VVRRFAVDLRAPVVLRAPVFRAPVFRAPAVFRPVLLRAVDFRAVDFRAVDFRVVDFRVVDFRAVDFRAVDFRAVDFRAVDFFAVDFRVPAFFAVDFRPPDEERFAVLRLRAGTFSPASRASDSPIATACLRLVTRPPWPALPRFNVPLFRRRIALATFFPAPRLYFRPPDFVVAIVPPCRGETAFGWIRCSRAALQG
jgi:hypothetical protein